MPSAPSARTSTEADDDFWGVIYPACGAIVSLSRSEGAPGDENAPLSIRALEAPDRAALLAIGASTQLLTPRSLDALLGDTLAALLDGRLSRSAHRVRVAHGRAADEVLGGAYLGLDARANGVWELWWLGALAAGAGNALLRDAADTVRLARGRLLSVSLTATDARRERGALEAAGFAQVGRVPNYYAAAEDKLVFSRSFEAVFAAPSRGFEEAVFAAPQKGFEEALLATPPARRSAESLAAVPDAAGPLQKPPPPPPRPPPPRPRGSSNSSPHHLPAAA
jgi:hypothetical protein